MRVSGGLHKNGILEPPSPQKNPLRTKGLCLGVAGYSVRSQISRQAPKGAGGVRRSDPTHRRSRAPGDPSSATSSRCGRVSVSGCLGFPICKVGRVRPLTAQHYCRIKLVHASGTRKALVTTAHTQHYRAPRPAKPPAGRWRAGHALPQQSPSQGTEPPQRTGNPEPLTETSRDPDFTIPPTRTRGGQKPPQDKDTCRLALGPEELTTQFQTSLRCETPPVSGQFPPPGLELLGSWEVKLRFCR